MDGKEVFKIIAISVIMFAAGAITMANPAVAWTILSSAALLVVMVIMAVLWTSKSSIYNRLIAYLLVAKSRIWNGESAEAIINRVKEQVDMIEKHLKEARKVVSPENKEPEEKEKNDEEKTD